MKFERQLAKKHEQPKTPEAIPVAENIQSAALKYGDEVFTGRTHEDAEAALKAAHPDFADEPEQYESGFITSEGRFVDRHDALDILVKSGEIKEKSEHMQLTGRYAQDFTEGRTE